jgi:hypothetical protein
MVYSVVGYCPCGQEIWLEYLRGPAGAWDLRFTDADGREHHRCPSCGRPLEEEGLEPA